MQKLLLISVLLSFYASALPVGAQDVDSLIKDAEAISKLSEQLFVSGQFDEALKYANKELSLRERIGDSKYIGSANFNLELSTGKNDSFT